jgi:hypothetical protein
MLIKSVLILIALTVCAPAAPVYSFDVFNAPDAFITTALGINDHGQVVGNFVPSGTGDQHGYIRQPDGSFEILDLPGDASVSLFGINNAGQIAGSLTDSGESRGFIRNPDGSFVFLDIPTSRTTVAAGIDEAGNALGQASFANDDGSSDTVAIVRRPDGSFLLNNIVPGASDQFLSDRNAAGRAVGTADAGGIYCECEWFRCCPDYRARRFTYLHGRHQ